MEETSEMRENIEQANHKMAVDVTGDLVPQ